jgi:hypothetical protein
MSQTTRSSSFGVTITQMTRGVLFVSATAASFSGLQATSLPIQETGTANKNNHATVTAERMAGDDLAARLSHRFRAQDGVPPAALWRPIIRK